ncbi:MAG: hypothetical protein P8011_17460, partial [Acidihalobacter sp.]
LIACLASVRLGGDGRQDAGQAALRRTRMAAGPVQACVREVACQGQAILGVRFFRRFLCALKEKIAGSDFSRQPRRGEAQGCAEQIGSGASPKQDQYWERRFAPETCFSVKNRKSFHHRVANRNDIPRIAPETDPDSLMSRCYPST